MKVGTRELKKRPRKRRSDRDALLSLIERGIVTIDREGAFRKSRPIKPRHLGASLSKIILEERR